MSGSDPILRGYGPSVRYRLHFDGDERNFELWHVKFMGYMTLRGLKDVIDPPPPSSTVNLETAPSTNEDGTPVVVTSTDPDPVKNAEAYAELIMYIDDRSLSLVMRDAANDGRKAMKILREHYMGQGKPRIITLWCELSSLMKRSSESVTDYIIRAENSASALRTASETVSDALLIAMVLKGLPDQFKPFEVVVTQNNSIITFAEFKIALRNYEDTENARGSRGESDSVKHFVHNNNNKKHFGGNSYSNNNNSRKQIVCYKCGAPGHKSPQCKNKQYCKLCKSNSHSDKACRKQNSNNSKNNENMSKMRDDTSHAKDEHSFHFVMRDVNEEDIITYHSTSEENLFLVDSGATSHVVCKDTSFISTDDSFIPQNHSITLADGSKTNGMAVKKGTIKLSLENSEGEIIVGVLEGVLHVPSYPQNIFSVKAALKMKTSVHFNADKPSYLRTPSGILFPTHVHENGLHYLRSHSHPVKSSSSEQSESEDFVCATRTVETWHKVLGHCNRSDLLKSKDVVDGMKISGTDEFDCESCHLGKLTQNISRKPDKRSNHPLEFVHTDLSGAVDPVSFDGHRYVIAFTDDYSGSVFTYFLKYKSDATKALEKFLADSAPYGTVKRMRCDNGGEFVGKEFKNVLIKNKIKQEPSCPDSPHQNGTAERWWRTCFGMSRCLLLESSLPKHMWTYAVMYSTHVRNRCFQQRTGQTPYYLLTNKVPNIKKLAIFGSVCYAYDHQRTKKLDARSKKGIFVGMDKESPAYLVYFPDDQKVRKYRTVKCTDKMYYDSDPRVESADSDEDSDDAVVLVSPKVPVSSTTLPVQPTVVPRANVPPVVEIPVANVTEDLQNDAQLMGEPVINVDVFVEPEHAQLVGEPEARYPCRQRRPPQHLQDYDTSTNTDVANKTIVDQVYTNVDYCFSASTMQIPKSYKEALESPQADQWKVAMDTEVKALLDNKTYSLVPLPQDKKAIGGRWVYTVKQNPDGSDLFKARYVARGYNQVYGYDYFETYSPTAKMTSVRMLMQYAVQHDLVMHQLDVKTAYLNAPVDCEIFMSQVEGYVDTEKLNHVCLLHKSLYGLKQSGRNWNILLTEFLKGNEFVASTADPCLYISKSRTDLILYWVDDIICACETTKKMNKIKNILKGKFKMKDLGPLKHFLGMHFEQIDSTVTIDQSLYLESILKKYQMSDCKPRATPCEVQTSSQSPVQVPEPCSDSRKYREIIGSLIYATTCTRPDLTWAVSRLSQNLASPRDIDWIMLKHVLRYVKGTAEYKLCYSKRDGDLELVGFSDSDWASSIDDRRSTSGYCFYMNTECSPISWKSKKQPTVALSSCEAEYMALGLCTQEALYLQRYISDLNVSSESLVIYSDSQSALDLVKNPVNHARSKHIDIKHHFIRENLVNGVVDYRYVSTNDNVADCFTKALAKLKFQSFLPKLLRC